MPNKHVEDVAVLIPSYQPDPRLPPYVKALLDAGFGKIVVVDDGSGPAYDEIFDSLAQEADNRVRVLRDTPNRGKGYALRTGMRYLADECPRCTFVVTADSDGQHTVTDVLRMAEALHHNGEGLLLGSRDFASPNVPKKSRLGNRITMVVFWLLYGKRVADTQTGLRGFHRKLLERFLQTKGDRYEYEMNQLIDCSTEKIPIRALPIETVYENNNENSHFHPVKDSWRIYRVIFARFLRFIAASLACFLVDYAIYLLLNNIFRVHAPALNQTLSFFSVHFIARIGLAAVLARAVSATLNFVLNRKVVFDSRTRMGVSFRRYAVTVVVIVCLSAWLTSGLNLWFGWNDNLVKMPVDILLFFMSYYVQRRWVFGGAAARAPSSDTRKDV
ncbi:MAG: bifunctional glycosyltransferase family 2/GtrA family protein [Eubacteriales bacterium]|nr:bifunctional glycosyltransferase family 2/GtrA family protein [Eubacteriales bacterium]